MAWGWKYSVSDSGELMVSLLSVLSSRNFTEGGFKEVKSKFLLLNDLVKIMQR